VPHELETESTDDVNAARSYREMFCSPCDTILNGTESESAGLRVSQLWPGWGAGAHPQFMAHWPRPQPF